jgi:hypothetical protein
LASSGFDNIKITAKYDCDEGSNAADSSVPTGCDVVETEFEVECSEGYYGPENVDVLSSDGKQVIFRLKHYFASELESVAVWFDDPLDPERLQRCWSANQVISDSYFGTFASKCTNGWAKVGIAAGSSADSSIRFKHFVEVVEPICQSGSDVTTFNPQKQCHFEMLLPCECDDATQKLVAEALENKKPSSSMSELSKCRKESKSVDVHSVAVDKCIAPVGEDSPITILSQDGDTVTVSVSQIWKGCGAGDMSKLSWIAADHVRQDGQLECTKYFSLNCGFVTAFTSQCDEGIAVIDLFTHDSDLGQEDGAPLVVPTPCNPGGDDTRKMCHFRYIVQCNPSKCKEKQTTKESRRLGGHSSNTEGERKKSFWFF